MKMLPLKENSDRNTQAQRQVITFLEIIFQWKLRAHCEFGLKCWDRYKDSLIQKTRSCCDSLHICAYAIIPTLLCISSEKL